MSLKQAVKNQDLNFVFKTLVEHGKATGMEKDICQFINSKIKFYSHFFGQLQPESTNRVLFQIYGSMAEQLVLQPNGDVDIMIFPTADGLMIHNELIEYLPEHPLHVRIKGADHPVLHSCLVEGTEYVATSALKNFHPAIFSECVGYFLPLALKGLYIKNVWQLKNSSTSAAATLIFGPAEPLGVDFESFFSWTEFIKGRLLSFKRARDYLELFEKHPFGTPIEVRDPQLREERREILRDTAGDVDLVPALRSLEWPKVAREWIMRVRKWPSPQVVNKIVQAGFHLVVKSPKVGGNRECDFRMSFTHAEYLLSQEMNDIQRECYLCLKKFHRAHLSTDPKGLLTYHLKNLFLQTVEETGAEMWTESNRAECVMKLLGNLLEALREKNLPHYFVKSYNLFCVDYIESPEVLEQIEEKVVQIVENPMRFATKLIQNQGSEGGRQGKEVDTANTQNADMDDIPLD